MATSDIKFRDSAKVRLLLYQIHSNSGGFTAAGFTAVKTKLLLLFLSLGIDYLILLRQNEGYLKELLGLTHSNTAATPT
ncbi:hypothetical protein J6590_063165 [Homalodisca vitripennis]|nr:hypothetical protein J6590_063165 [Homalodisca vitripennis]